MSQWQCLICGYIYDETLGDPESGVEPGTPWGEVPESWFCPDCGASKLDFVMNKLDEQ
ncbi:MAG: rubredoxin [Gammaproteobacteria bacterium RIFCSPHIGHO2_12_FULL_35_23]|nr:MAG: rubredoxin [Gammaproteobacteria bacterium RIFCSPHIGHO2_12_FULL_35_23]